MEERKFYESPQIEIIEVDVEKGFATSNTSNTEPYNEQAW